MATETDLLGTRPAAKQVYKMRELSQYTARVIQEISDSGEPALITLRGRFVAVIKPLADGELEGRLISAALEQSAVETYGSLGGRPPLSTEEAAERLGIALPPYSDRDVSE